MRLLRQWIAFKRGSMLLRKERWQPAASLLSRAIELTPGHWEAHHNLTIALLKLERWEEAAGMAQRAIRLNPGAVDSHDLFGIALLQLARWEEAIAAYREAVTLDPRRFDSYDRLGMALLRLERWEELVDACEAALRLDSGRQALHNRLGIALLHLGCWDAAALAFRRATELATDDPAAAPEFPGLLSSFASAAGRRREASSEEVSNLRAELTGPAAGAAAHLSLGIELLKLERWEEAVTTLMQGHGFWPDAGTWQFLCVDPLVRLGRPGEAVAAHQRAAAAGESLPQLPVHPAPNRFAQREAAFWTVENLGPDVFAVERWLEELTVVRDHVPAAPRLLFVLDNDFGELTTVKYFLLGREMAGCATLLLPERLYAHNRDAIPGRTRRYRSVADILEAVDRERPAIVLLCSGYLLWEHLSFAPEEVAGLVEGLRERGCRVVTADPFLGMLSKQSPRTLIHIDVPTNHPVWTVEQLASTTRPQEERMWANYTVSEQILRDACHLYPSHCEVPDEDRTDTDERNLEFFNDRLLFPGPSGTPASGKPLWLFILTGADCQMQMLFEGESGFMRVVARKLVETLAAGRHPILIAPKEFIEPLIECMPTAEGIDILSHRPFNQFMSLLLAAEQVFYWNAVSHSLLIRLYNQLPIVLFDRGHLVRNAPAIYPRVVRWYYQGWAPALRSHHEPLTLATVEEWTAEYRRHAARLAERYRRAPSPEEVVARLMRRAVIQEPHADATVR
jgi:tetratricopeptide (TPR) repeat protein